MSRIATWVRQATCIGDVVISPMGCSCQVQEFQEILVLVLVLWLSYLSFHYDIGTLYTFNSFKSPFLPSSHPNPPTLNYKTLTSSNRFLLYFFQAEHQTSSKNLNDYIASPINDDESIDGAHRSWCTWNRSVSAAQLQGCSISDHPSKDCRGLPSSGQEQAGKTTTAFRSRDTTCLYDRPACVGCP